MVYKKLILFQVRDMRVLLLWKIQVRCVCKRKGVYEKGHYETGKKLLKMIAAVHQGV